jgi:multidrug efflux system membrane fusion protein
MYASVRLGTSAEINALLISERAIGTDQDKKFVYVVNNEGKIAYRKVTLGGRVQGKRIVLSGLKVGEKVVVNSLQRVRPDMAVKAIDVAQEQGAAGQSAKLAYNR